MSQQTLLTPPQPDDSDASLDFLRRVATHCQSQDWLSFLDISLQTLDLCGGVPTPLMCYWRGPVMIGKTAWSDTIPPWLITAVRFERFLKILDELEQGQVTEMATPAEIVCALQPYTLTAPLRSDLAELLIWAFGEVLKQHNGKLDGCSAAPVLMQEFTDIPFKRIEYSYRDLSLTLRRKVVRLAPSTRRRAENPSHESDGQPPAEHQVQELPLTHQQISLFNLFSPETNSNS